MRALLLVPSLFFAAALGLAASCSGESQPSSPNGSGGHGTTTTTTSANGGSGGGLFMDGGDGPYLDFPEDPIIDSGLPANIADLFANAPSSNMGGPCLSEPAVDAMVPRNWTPLLFEWTSDPALTVFELRLDVDNQINPLVIYTTNLAYTINDVIWDGLTDHSAGKDIQVRVRGAGFDGSSLTTEVRLGVEGPIHLAPVEAPGSVVYWTASGGTSFQGFTIGDTSSKIILTPATAGTTSTGGNTTCVSCHTSSPDGKLLIYSRDADNGTRAVDVRKIDGTPADPTSVSPSALTLLGRHRQTVPLTSAAHYAANDAVAITVLSDPNINGGRYELVWTDLHASDTNAWGVLARNGDPRNVSSPSWSHDGETIAYVSSAGGGEGVVAATTSGDPTMDIYTVPYNNRQGGNATPLPGASDPNYREFYPVYSPGDLLLAYNRTNQPVNSYDQPSAEVFVLPAAGGVPTRLKANDPPACTGLTSPGLTNSWARWAPQAETFGDRKYYWLVFSSKRRANSNGAPQLYISAVVTRLTSGGEALEGEYPALYVTAQDPVANNHTPAWDVFEVSQLPPN